MKPIDTFYFLKHNKTSFNGNSLMQAYFPVIGSDALAVYHYLLSFYDNGQKQHKFSDILNHLQFGMQRFEEALDVLMAMNLIVFYQDEQAYYFKLNSALPTDLFIENPVYRKLLENKIGEVAVDHLICKVPTTLKNISKRFSQVFSELGDLQTVSKRPQNFFDLNHFKQLMLKDGLSFANESTDVIGLYHLAEQFNLNWFETYQLAKETAMKQKISLKRMLAKKQLPQNDNSEFSQEEMGIIKEAQADKADVFLAKLKKLKEAVITSNERKILFELAEMGFLDEVINIMVLYTMLKTKSANVNKTYIMKIANDFSYHKIASAKEAVIKMRRFSDKKKQGTSYKEKSPQKSNVPQWSNDHYKNETTEDQQAKLEEMKRRHLEKLRKKAD